MKAQPDCVPALFLVPTLRRGGAEMQLISLVNRLSRFNVHATVVPFHEDIPLLGQLDERQVGFLHLPRKRRLDMEMLRSAATFVDENQISVIHATLQISVFMAHAISRLSARRPPVIAAVHTTVNRSKRDDIFERLLYRRLLRKSARVIFVCKTQFDFWANKYPELRDNGRVIYNGIDVQHFDPRPFRDQATAFRERLKIGSNDRVIICIAGFRPEKGHFHLLEAFAKLGAHWHLVLAGKGELEEQLRQKVANSGSAERIHFLGEIADVRPALASADVSVLASTAVETFSIAMLESLAMGVPIVASDIGGLGEAIRPGVNGELVSPGKPSELAGALKKVAEFPDIAQHYSQAARRSVEEHFTADSMAQLTAAQIREVGLAFGSRSAR